MELAVATDALALERLYHWERTAPDRVVLTQPRDRNENIQQPPFPSRSIRSNMIVNEKVPPYNPNIRNSRAENIFDDKNEDDFEIPAFIRKKMDR